MRKLCVCADKQYQCLPAHGYQASMPKCIAYRDRGALGARAKRFTVAARIHQLLVRCNAGISTSLIAGNLSDNVGRVEVAMPTLAALVRKDRPGKRYCGSWNEEQVLWLPLLKPIAGK